MILIGNGPLITWDKDHPFYEKGALVLSKDKIIDIGDFNELKNSYPTIEIMDVQGKVIMPGFIDAHEHIYSAFARGSSLPKEPPKDFVDILEGTWWKLDRNLTLENTYYSAMMTYIECIKNGITFVCDHHASYMQVKGSLFEIAKAAKELSIRTCLSYEISDRDGIDKSKQAIEENMEFAEYCKKYPSSMLHALVGLHASFTLSDDTLDLIQKENKYETGYHVHIAEGSYDQSYTQEKYHQTVVERFYSRGILNEKSLAGHCVHITKEDIPILKKARTPVLHNPESNMGNAVGTTDVLQLFDEGICVGLGTDGYTHDMLESLKVANILQKHTHQDPARGFMEACTMMFENNAYIASTLTNQTLGILKKGAQADVIAIDYHPATPMDATNLYGHIMFGMTGAQADTVIINGKVQMRSRILQNIDEAAILKHCQQSAKDVWKRLEK